MEWLGARDGRGLCPSPSQGLPKTPRGIAGLNRSSGPVPVMPLAICSDLGLDLGSPSSSWSFLIPSPTRAATVVKCLDFWEVILCALILLSRHVTLSSSSIGYQHLSGTSWVLGGSGGDRLCFPDQLWVEPGSYGSREPQRQGLRWMVWPLSLGRWVRYKADMIGSRHMVPGEGG